MISFNKTKYKQAINLQTQIDWVKAKLVKAEQSEFTNDSKEDILAQAKSRLNG